MSGESHSFVQSPLPVTEPEPEIVPLDSFVEFFENPCRYWLRHQLGVWFPPSTKRLEEAEPIDIKGLNHFWAMQSLIRDKWEHEEEKQRSVSAYLPVGEFGSAVMDDLEEKADSFVEFLDQIGLGSTGEPFEIDLQLKRVRLRGKLRHVMPAGYLKFRYAKLKPQQLLGAWLEHLTLCATAMDRRHRSYLVGKDKWANFSYVTKAPKLLRSLEKVFLDGSRSPQPIFPLASYDFAKEPLFG